MDKKSIEVGARVELHPATSLWMRGARFGTVEKFANGAYVVRLDQIPGRTYRISPCNLSEVAK